MSLLELTQCIIGEFEDPTFEAQDSKRIRGQGLGLTFREQPLSRGQGCPDRNGRDQGHNFSKLWSGNVPLFKCLRYCVSLRF